MWAGMVSCKVWCLIWCSSLLFHAAHLQSASEAPRVSPLSFRQEVFQGQLVYINDNKFFGCTAEAPDLYRPLAISWLKDGQFIVTNDTASGGALRLQVSSLNDRGTYQCMASSRYGAILSNEVQLRIAYLNKTTLNANRSSASAEQISVADGGGYLLEGPEVDSEPDPSVSWHLVDQVLGQSRYFHKTLSSALCLLDISSARNGGGKYYQAKIELQPTGDFGFSPKYYFTVSGAERSVIAPELLYSSGNVSVKSTGVNLAELECVFTARPMDSLSIAWYRLLEDGTRQAISTGDGHYSLQSHNRVLRIRGQTPADSGLYECEATMSGQPSAKALLQLIVGVMPTLRLEGVNEVMSLDHGQPLQLTVTVSGTPQPSLRCYKNGRIITDPSTSRPQLVNGTVLYIEKVRSSDSGFFQCIADNFQGQASKFVYLHIRSFPPVFSEQPDNTTVVAGNNAKLQCAAQGAPEPSITWSRDVGSGREELRSGGRFDVTDRQLLVANVLHTDSGLYTCTASNAQGDAAASASVHVLRKTEIREPPRNLSATKSHEVTVPCVVSHDPSIDITVLWFQSSNADINEFDQVVEDQRRKILATGSLHIAEVAARDIGMYRCEVYSEAGNVTARGYLTVIEAPHPPAKPVASLAADNNRHVLITWNPGFDGNSPLTGYRLQFKNLSEPGVIVWRDLEDSLAPSIRSYRVETLLPAIQYTFQVAGVNAVGRGEYSPASNTLTLPEQKPSAAPRDLTASPRTNTSIDLTWYSPPKMQWNGQLKGYRVQYRVASDSTAPWRESNYQLQGHPGLHDEDTRVDYELNDLLVNTRYLLRVAAWNDVGVGPYTPEQQSRTRQGIPSAPPERTSVVAISSQEIQLRWSPPKPHFIYGTVKGYRINMWNMVAHQLRTVVHPVDATAGLVDQSRNVSALDKYTTYIVNILCFTEAGNGPPSANTTVTTLQDVPGVVVVQDLNYTAPFQLQVMWAPPIETNGILTGYQIYYLVSGSKVEPVMISNLTSERLNTTITGLTSDTRYVVGVAAKTIIGHGPYANKTGKTGPKPVLPGQPQSLAYTNLGTRSVRLQFSLSARRYVHQWKVLAELNGQGDFREIQTYDDPQAKETSILVTGLRPYTEYRLKVAAVNLVGQGEPSPPSPKFQTLSDAPDSPPGNISMRSLNSTALRIRWAPLSRLDWNGVPRGYQLTYHRVSDEIGVSYENRTVIVSDATSYSYVLTGLHAYTRYRLWILARNPVGRSPLSEPVTAFTREIVPTAAPSIVNATAVDATRVRVYWSAIEKDSHNGILLGYKVTLTPVTGDSSARHVRYVRNATVLSAVLSGLLPYTEYSVHISAYTRLGDGPQTKPEYFTTHPAPALAPMSLWFPVVSLTSVTCQWSLPARPNGELLSFSVQYKPMQSTDPFTVVDLAATKFTHEVPGLAPRTTYVFRVSAKNTAGQGRYAIASVVTATGQTLPVAPTGVHISRDSISSRALVLAWNSQQPAAVGLLRNFTLSVLEGSNRVWRSWPAVIQPSATTYNLTGLQPDTQYSVRLVANNDFGSSNFSVPSAPETTLQEAPSVAPGGLRVQPKTTTSIHVQFDAIPASAWHARDSRRYVIYYRELYSGSVSEGQSAVGHMQTSTEVIVPKPGHLYEIRVAAGNGRGLGPKGPPVDVYVGEAVPTEPPSLNTFVALNSSAIRVTFAAPPLSSRNGELIGYTLFYEFTGAGVSRDLRRRRHQIWSRLRRSTGTRSGSVSVSPSATSVTVTGLAVFSRYSIQMLATNLAGNGPNTSAVVIQTDQDIPGAPGTPVFSAIRFTSLNVSWTIPTLPNGVIQQYEISISGDTQELKNRVDGSVVFYLATQLVANVNYTFSIRAYTIKGWGPAATASVVTGPQPGSPAQPLRLKLRPDGDRWQLTWQRGATGDSAIQFYIIQFTENGGEWQNGPDKNGDDEASHWISLQNLKPAVEYSFRVIAVNRHGVSPPSLPTVGRTTPAAQAEQTSDSEFYEHWWFQVIVALVALILIILLIFLLCMCTRRNKPAQKQHNTSLYAAPVSEPITSVRALGHMNGGTTAPTATDDDDDGFAYEMQRRPQRHGGTLGRKIQQRNMLNAAYTKPPPRPSPASVAFSEAETESKLPYTETDVGSSSKGSSISSDSDSDDSSWDDEKLPPPPPPHQHYDDGASSSQWYPGHAAQPPTHASSDPWPPYPEPPQAYAETLQVGYTEPQSSFSHRQDTQNNQAGSRAPLPAFSSFV